MKFVLLLLLTFLYTACAAKKIALENADSLISYQVTKRLPLYSAQKDELAKDIDKFLNGAKTKTQEIIPILDALDLKDPEKLNKQYPDIEAFYLDMATHFSTLTSKYLAKLDIKQQKDMFETLDEENQKIKKRSKKNQIEVIEDRFDAILGSINAKQKKLVKEYESYFISRSKDRLNRRLKLQEEMKGIYSLDISESSRQNYFQESLSKYQAATRIGSKNLELLKKVVPTLSAGQKVHLKNEILEFKSLVKYFNTIEY